MLPRSQMRRAGRTLTRCGVGLWIVLAAALSPGDGQAAAGAPVATAAHTARGPAPAAEPAAGTGTATGTTVTFTVLAGPPVPPQPPPENGLAVTGTIALLAAAVGALLVAAGFATGRWPGSTRVSRSRLKTPRE